MIMMAATIPPTIPPTIGPVLSSSVTSPVSVTNGAHVYRKLLQTK